MKKSVKFGNEIVSKNIKTRLEKAHFNATLIEILSNMPDIEYTEEPLKFLRLADLKECLTEAKEILGITKDEIEVMVEEADAMSLQNMQRDNFDGDVIHTNVNIQQFVDKFSH